MKLAAAITALLLLGGFFMAATALTIAADTTPDWTDDE